jgi:hypothetical protein
VRDARVGNFADAARSQHRPARRILMGGVNVDGGAKGGRRSLDAEINMIPMIDLLMVTISFLLITAVWVSSARLPANANVNGPTETVPPCQPGEKGCEKEPRLHVMATDPRSFLLTWKLDGAVVRSIDVPRERHPGGSFSYPGLAKVVGDEWRAAGVHRDPSDRTFDRAVVHTPDDMPYAELVAIMDAIAAPRRPVATGSGASTDASAFLLTFAAD